MSIFYFTITDFELCSFFCLFVASLSYFMITLCVPCVNASRSMTFIFERVSMFWFCYQQTELRSSQAMWNILKSKKENFPHFNLAVSGPQFSFCIPIMSLKVQKTCKWRYDEARKTWNTAFLECHSYRWFKEDLKLWSQVSSPNSLFSTVEVNSEFAYVKKITLYIWEDSCFFHFQSILKKKINHPHQMYTYFS